MIQLGFEDKLESQAWASTTLVDWDPLKFLGLIYQSF